MRRRATNRKQNPMGFIPLAVWAGAAIATALVGFFAYDENDAAWRNSLKPPKPTPAPAAPQTPAEMDTWTPPGMEAQNRKDSIKWGRTAIPGGEPGDIGSNDYLLAALAIGTIAGGLVLSQ